jgi:hypothetical protein
VRRVKPGALGRLRWAIRTGRKPTSLAGLLRRWWADFIIHPLFEAGERCQDCGRGSVLWRAPDELYAEVHGSLHGVLCPACFDRQAAAMGIVIRFEAREVGRRHNAPSRRSRRYTPELPG